MKRITHNVFEKWPLEDRSVQAIITSPPYWSLRKYDVPDVVIGGDPECKHEFEETRERFLNLQAGNPEFRRPWRENASAIYNNGAFCIKCKAWKGQYGLEPDFRMYVLHTVIWTREAWRVLKDDGIMFLNMGDTFTSSGSPTRHWNYEDPKYPEGRAVDYYEPSALPQGKIKPKCKLLIPHRVAIALIDEGWILRNDIIWHKINALPESVADRFAKRFENIFMLVKNPRYYFDLDAVREEHSESTKERVKYMIGGKEKSLGGRDKGAVYVYGMKDHIIEKGKNPGDIWSIATEKSSVPHYAMFPTRLVERMILCSTRAGDTVLDPFCGSGTTLMVAEKLNRVGIGFDIGYEDVFKIRTSGVQKELFT